MTDTSPHHVSTEQTRPTPLRTTPFFVLVKPAGPACNLRCKYCFYLEKKELYERSQATRMQGDTLELFIREYINSQDCEEVTFGWQGGEPTLRGLDFFRRVVELQHRHANGRKINNALQTNGTLIDGEWAEFLARNSFLVGISIDGPADLHDAHRVDATMRPTLDHVLRGLAYLKEHAVDFNTLTVVGRHNVRYPAKVYRFLKEIGSRYMQFIPLVERRTKGARVEMLAGPPVGGGYADTELAGWSVGSLAYGQFLTGVFEHWVRHDVGTTFVQMFDETLGAWSGHGSSLCVFAPTCGRQAVMEHDGRVYACDHYVYPEFELGNINDRRLPELIDSPQQRSFGAAKRASLPGYCRRCEFLPLCNGGCPKHRFLHTPDGEPGLNYLCAGYRHYFRSVAPYMHAMAGMLRAGRAPAEIMSVLPTSKGKDRRLTR